MATFGRIVGGSVTDVCMGPDVATATSQAFAADYVAKVGGVGLWTQIPDGTAESATTADAGKSFTPPASPQVAVVTPVAGIQDCYAALSAIALKLGTVIPPIAGK